MGCEEGSLAVSPSRLCYTLHMPLKLSGFQRRKMNQTQTLAPTFPCSPITRVNERIWGVFHHQAESYLTHCSQFVPSQLWLDTGGVPDPAQAVLEGSVLLQSIADLSDLASLRLFPSLCSGKSKRISLLASFLRLENSRPCGSYGGRGMQRDAAGISHMLCPCPSPVLCSSRLWPGCAPHHCPWAGRHRRQLSSADKMLPTTQSEQF